jgi:hypothetical protein
VPASGMQATAGAVHVLLAIAACSLIAVKHEQITERQPGDSVSREAAYAVKD